MSTSIIRRSLRLGLKALPYIAVAAAGSAVTAWAKLPYLTLIEDGEMHRFMCAKPGGTWADPSQRMVVMREAGNQNSPEASLQCVPK